MLQPSLGRFAYAYTLQWHQFRELFHDEMTSCRDESPLNCKSILRVRSSQGENTDMIEHCGHGDHFLWFDAQAVQEKRDLDDGQCVFRPGGVRSLSQEAETLSKRIALDLGKIPKVQKVHRARLIGCGAETYAPI